MIAAHIILGLSLIGFAFWLQSTEAAGWPNESYDSDLDADYLGGRKRSRRRVNVILGACGVLILVANADGPWLFIICWLCVTLALMTVVVLAGLDALRTHRYHAKKLPEIRKQMLDLDQPTEPTE